MAAGPGVAALESANASRAAPAIVYIIRAIGGGHVLRDAGSTASFQVLRRKTRARLDRRYTLENLRSCFDSEEKGNERPLSANSPNITKTALTPENGKINPTTVVPTIGAPRCQALATPAPESTCRRTSCGRRFNEDCAKAANHFMSAGTDAGTRRWDGFWWKESGRL